MKQLIAYVYVVLALAGCATPDQLRQTEAQTAEQGYAVKSLRAGQDSNASLIKEVRAELSQSQQSMHALEASVVETQARADTAQATSKELLASVVAAREEQRRQLDQNGAAFAELRRRNAEMDAKLQVQQRALEQSATASVDATRRLNEIDTKLQGVTRRAAALETKSGNAQVNDVILTQQITALSKEVAETRALINSEGLLQLMREVEDLRRNSASLRGSIEELQKSQADAAVQIRNFYVDLDTRIRLLKQSPGQQAVKQNSPAAQSVPAGPTQDAGAAPLVQPYRQ
ncbi:MAG TPA: YbgF trimerization domain-containing protein [Burkholderiales bacterium]|nr:YbgF trimerization domain-containing protein [Burkholderiales bacterium]